MNASVGTSISALLKGSPKNLDTSYIDNLFKMIKRPNIAFPLLSSCCKQSGKSESSCWGVVSQHGVSAVYSTGATGCVHKPVVCKFFRTDNVKIPLF